MTLMMRKRHGIKTVTAAPTTSNGLNEESPGSGPTRMRQLFGFDWSDLSSWESFLALLHRPTDPASLAITRVLFGSLMFLDTFQERGLAFADHMWGDPFECRFPLFNFLTPLPLQWMLLVYVFMILGSLGIILGLFYRTSVLMFAIPYWYMFLLDKPRWNNHSYLYGVVSFLLLFMDANRYWSLDGLLSKKIRNSHTPLWNIAVLRFQIFLVYFYAGLKKTETDWLMGYSMEYLSKNWCFAPFRLLLTNDQIDLYIVHGAGFVLDLTLGFFLFFDATRPFAIFFGAQFHLMNSTMFAIGMFPWTMLATLPLFCYCDWPRPIFQVIGQKVPRLKGILPLDSEPQPSSHCIYPKDEIKPEDEKENRKKDKLPPVVTKRSKTGWYHRVVFAGVLLHISLQLFLPYSHFITKGYNNWTNGLYGYSWDMMVHSWRTQHVRITYVNKDTGDTGYLNHKAFSNSKRWCSHADMLKQVATCIEQRLTSNYGMKNVELYFDVWKSLNNRFQQRNFDPRVNVIEAEWHPFKDTSWGMPLLVGLTDWRDKLIETERNIFEGTNDTDVVFVADFPGLSLENYVQPDYSNTSLTVLHGQVNVEIRNGKNYTLNKGDELQMPAGQFHTVHTISSTPSCYMYIFVNTTEVEFVKNLTLMEERLKAQNKTYEALSDSDPTESFYKHALINKEKVEAKKAQTILQKFLESAKKILRRKHVMATRSVQMIWLSLRATVMGESFDELLVKFTDDELEKKEEIYGDEED